MMCSPRAMRCWTATLLATFLLAMTGCDDDDDTPPVEEVPQPQQGSDGPADQGPPFDHATGDATRGRDVFRFETFGNEGFWTDAMRLPQGVVAAGLTPKQALEAGMSVDVEMLDEATRQAVAAELAAQGTNGPLLNDPATTLMLINANAVLGVVVKDTNRDGTLDVMNGDKVGLTCASCHSITDGSVLNLPDGGGIGRRVDGPTPHNLNVGGILALAANSRAYYPLLQVKLTANGDKSIGRAPSDQGLTKNSTEAEVDAYLNNPDFYPRGSFDDGADGNGAPQHITPMFRTDLSAPWGTDGSFARIDNFNNTVYTALLDPTSLVTPDGRNFIKRLGGAAAGDELIDDYLKILRETQVRGPGGVVGEGFPYTEASTTAEPAGSEAALVGRRVDNQKLLDMNAYTNSLPAPEASGYDDAAASRGRELFRRNCTTCHNVDQSRPVPSFVVPMTRIFPGYNPTILAQRPVEPPFRPMALAPIQDDPASIYDDKTVVVDASQRMDLRGSVMPLLLDLARKPNFLHDSSVPTFDALLNPSRGANAPHAVYLEDEGERADVAEFLKSLDTTP